MALAVAENGFRTLINVFNYYNPYIVGDGFASDAVIEIIFFDADGRQRFVHCEELSSCGSLQFDLGQALAASSHSGDTIGTAYVRLIPRVLPPGWGNGRVSTEFTTEIISPSGKRSIFHNSGSSIATPSVQQMKTGQLISDGVCRLRYLVLANNYFGPRIPYLSVGLARVKITNWHGETRTAVSRTVPPRGLRLFPMEEAFPGLVEFLDGRSGRLHFRCCNLLRKPWIWICDPNDEDSISIEHF